MLKHQINHSHSYHKSLLSWRGMQAWCLGKRASGLCRFFIRVRTRPKLRIASILTLAKPRIRQASFLKWLAHTEKLGRAAPACCLPIMKDRHAQCPNLMVQFPDVSPQWHPKPLSEGVYMRSQRLCKRVDESPTEALEMPEFRSRLGSGEGSLMSYLQRQVSNGEISLTSLSLSSSSSSRLSDGASATGGLHRSRLKEACAKVVHGGPSICELVAGNQFLVHLSAAPVAATPPHSFNGGLSTGGNPRKDRRTELNPSMGLPPLRYKESDINDRIVFFK